MNHQGIDALATNMSDDEEITLLVESPQRSDGPGRPLQSTVSRRTCRVKNGFSVFLREHHSIRTACYFDWLPNEVLFHVFQSLPARDLLSMASVCQRWNDILQDRHMWWKKVETDFPMEFRTISEVGAADPKRAWLRLFMLEQVQRERSHAPERTYSNKTLQLRMTRCSEIRKTKALTQPDQAPSAAYSSTKRRSNQRLEGAGRKRPHTTKSLRSLTSDVLWMKEVIAS